MKQDITAVILAAGESTRLKSKTSKVLHQVAGRRCLDWVVQAVTQAGISQTVVVGGQQMEAMRNSLPAEIKSVQQKQALGTAHAVKVSAAVAKRQQGQLVVLCGDAPLITAATLKQLITQHHKQQAAATLVTAELEQPHGYGRIIRNHQQPSQIVKIVEEKDADDQERAIKEINSGIYCFEQAVIWELLKKIKKNNRKGEYYLTDVIDLLRQQQKLVGGLRIKDANELLGINTRQQLVKVGQLLNQRVINKWLDRGVTIKDPVTTWIDDQVVIGRDSIIEPGTQLTGPTKIASDCVIGPYTTIHASTVGRQTVVRQSVIDHSRVGAQVKVGPFAHLRAGNKIGDRVKIGNFIELNRSQVAANVKIGHLGYIGDTEIETDVNIGAGTITANYDGYLKHRTKIGSQSFIGSGSIIVAPNKIGKNCLTGAGAVLKAQANFPANTVIVGVPARAIKKRKSQSRGKNRDKKQ